MSSFLIVTVIVIVRFIDYYPYYRHFHYYELVAVTSLLAQPSRVRSVVNSMVRSVVTSLPAQPSTTGETCCPRYYSTMLDSVLVLC